MVQNIVITFDGTSGSGKGSIASRVAKALGLKYLDTGRLYRGFAYIVNRDNLHQVFEAKADAIAKQITSEVLNLDELYSEDIAKIASKIAKSKAVRQSLIDLQRDFVVTNKGGVLDGRDTGSVICPNADYKFYVDADLKIRAERRLIQMQEKGILDKTLDQVVADLASRDEQDKSRVEAPLIIPKGAVQIDNSHCPLAETVKKVLELIDK